MMWAMVGSATAPRPSEHIVMPSCAPASIRVSSRIPASAETARLLPSAASCSIRERRAASRANSAATKNPLSASRTTANPRAPHCTLKPDSATSTAIIPWLLGQVPRRRSLVTVLVVAVGDAGIGVELQQDLRDRELFDFEHLDPDAVDDDGIADVAIRSSRSSTSPATVS